MLRKVMTCFTALMVSVLLCACTDEQRPEAAGQDRQKTADAPASAEKNAPELHLGVMPSMDYLPLAVALREGYCDELGLKLTIHKFYSANERDAALQGDAVHGAVIDFTGAVLQKAGGFALRLTSRCDAPFYLLAAKDRPVSRPADLKGMSIAVSRHTVIDYVVDAALAAGGLTPDDVQKMEINKIPLRFEMLRSGKIDATGLPNPAALLAQAAGCRVLTSNQELGFAVTGIVFTEKGLRAQEENIRKMYRAYDKGVEYLQTHPVEAVKDILIADMGFTEELLAAAALHYDKARLPSEREVRNVVDWLAAKKLIPADFSVTSLMDGRFVSDNAASARP